jgi:PhoH-like ATPase
MPPKSKVSGNRLFVLDTNVLIHDPMALFAFDEHDIYIPLVVLEELDNHKKGATDNARNVRECLRIMDEVIGNADAKQIAAGLSLVNASQAPGIKGNSAIGKEGKQGLGNLHFEMRHPVIKQDTPIKADNIILQSCLFLIQNSPRTTSITLVTKDINLRIKASAAGVRAEDYFSDHVIEDADLLHTGIRTVASDYFSNDLTSWTEKGTTFYRVAQEDDEPAYYPNECIKTESDDGFKAIVHAINGNSVVLKFPIDYVRRNHSVWGMHARNEEQNFALNFLMDNDIDLVTLLGPAGTGKTMLALASALEQTVERKIYDEIIVTRATVPLGEDIGFLPGTEEEKMAPWMGAINDNIEALLRQDKDTPKWQKENTTELIMSKIKIKSMAFMRGRTFQNKFVIIDEAQNLTAKQMKSLITRVGVNTKIICIGNIAQIDTPYLSPSTSGLTYLVDVMKGWQHGAHITLQKGERSRLASYAQEVMF